MYAFAWVDVKSTRMNMLLHSPPPVKLMRRNKWQPMWVPRKYTIETCYGTTLNIRVGPTVTGWNANPARSSSGTRLTE